MPIVNINRSDSEPVALYYRPEMLDQAGVKPPAPGMMRTS